MGVRDLDADCREARGRGSSHHGDREELGSPRALQAAGGGDARARWLLVAVEEAEDGAGPATTENGRMRRGCAGTWRRRGHGGRRCHGRAGRRARGAAGWLA